MGRLRFAPVATLYVAVVALLTVTSRLAAYPRDLVSFSALALTMPAGVLSPLLTLAPRHLGWFALPALALLNALLLRRLHRLLPRDRVQREVEARLDDALISTGLKVTPMVHGTGRRDRSLLLRDVPIVFAELAGVYRELWGRAGLRVEQRESPPGLRAVDADGYVFTLEPGPGVFGDAVLRVVAPASGRGLFLAGLLAGAVPCVTAAWSGSGSVLLLTGWAALLTGLPCLVAPRTRSFGRGLLLGGTPALLVLVVTNAV